MYAATLFKSSCVIPQAAVASYVLLEATVSRQHCAVVIKIMSKFESIVAVYVYSISQSCSGTTFVCSKNIDIQNRKEA